MNVSLKMFPIIESPSVNPTQVFLKPSKKYQVHGFSVYSGTIYILVVDDIDRPFWYPSIIFDAFDNTIDINWVIKLYDGDVSMIVGPSFISESLKSYSDMVELDSDMVEKFWCYLRENYAS